MTETLFISLDQAAGLEGVKYNTLVQKIKRNPDSYEIKYEPRVGGKDRVLISISSLSAKARKSYKAAQKVSGSDVIVEQRTSDAPWYIGIDLNWYIENNRQSYYVAVELSKQIERFISYSDGERTTFADEYAAQLGISQRTLYRYAEAYLEAKAWALKHEREEEKCFDYYMVLALCRKPKESFTFPSLTEEQKALIENIWFDKGFAQNQGTIEMLYWKFTEVAIERAWEGYPSIKTVARYIKYLMDEVKGGRNAHYLAANGMREFKNKRMLKGKRDIKSLAVMEFVQGDEHTFDCWVQYTSPNGKVKAVRPKLVAWIDTRSRVIMGDVFCVDANAQILKESFVKMVYTFGVPKHLHIDNGKDYTAETMTGQKRNERQMQELTFDSETIGFYRSIGVDEWSRSLPYEPWGKGQIERFFRTVCEMFTKWMDSYVGTLTGSRTTAKRKKDINGMLERGELLTMEEFFDLWTKWKNERYHQKEHESLRKDKEKYKTPIGLFEKAEEKYVKAAPPREYATMLLMKADSALVRNQGIIKFGTLYTDYELCHYVGQKVNVKWDIDDITKLYVFDQKGKKICEAVSAELLQIAPKVPQALLEEHLKKQKRQIREAREFLEEATKPFEARVQEGTPTVVGNLDLTVKAKRNSNLIQLPNDKEYRDVMKTGSKNLKQHKDSDDEFFNQKAQSALEKLRALG